MTCLITGARGFIGGHTVRHFLDRGWTVWAHTGRSGAGIDIPRAHVLWGDLTEPDGSWPKNVDLVVHIAGQDHFSGVAPDVMARNNVRSTERMVEYARRAGARLIFLSAISAFGKVEAGRLDEDTPPDSPEPYGASKLACESVLAAAKDAVPVRVLRIPGVVGPGAWTPWLARTLAALRQNKDVTIYTPEFPFNNVVHVDGLAAFMEQLGRTAFDGYDMMVIGAAEAIPVRTVVDLLREMVGSTSVVNESNAPRTPFILSTKRAEETYGYRPDTVKNILSRYAQDS